MNERQIRNKYHDFKELSDTLFPPKRNAIGVFSQERLFFSLLKEGKLLLKYDIEKKEMFFPKKYFHLSRKVVAYETADDTCIKNVPAIFFEAGIISAESQKEAALFFDKIFDGIPTGIVNISIFTGDKADQKEWVKLMYYTVFNREDKPMIAFIFYENVTSQRNWKMSFDLQQQELEQMDDSSYTMMEYNIENGENVDVSGRLLKIREDASDAATIQNHIADEVSKRYRAKYLETVDNAELRRMFRMGNKNEELVFRYGDDRWIQLSIRLFVETNACSLYGRFLYRDITEEKKKELEEKKYLERIEKELADNRIKVMMNQMKPHFLYNALSSIQTIVLYDPEYAYKLIQSFSTHLRGSIKALSDMDEIPFAEELKNIEAYVEIEQMRMGERLKMVYEIHTEDFYVMPLTIQPLVENAIRHGIYPKGRYGGTVWLRTFSEQGYDVITVEDDGVGFDVNKVFENDMKGSFGLKNVIFRVEKIMNAEIDFKAREAGGAMVTMRIKHREEPPAYGLDEGTKTEPYGC